jgi:hypothetical protein
MNQHVRSSAQLNRASQFAAGLFIILLIAACGGSPEPTPTPTTPPLPTAVPATTAPSPRIVPSPTPAAVSAAAPITPTIDTSAASPANSANCTNKAANVRDVNIPDGTVLNRGETFTKTWLIKNAGTCTWNESYTIVFNVGDRLDGKDGVKLPNTPPGADAEVSVPMRASLRPGKFQGFWKLRAPDGRDFGTGAEANVAFWVLIDVK